MPSDISDHEKVDYMNKILIALFFAFLVFGCMAPYSGDANQTTAPGANITPQENKTTDVQENVTAPANVSENDTTEMNETQAETNATTAPQYTQTNLSVEELLAQNLDSIRGPGGGPYKIVTYEWVSNEVGTDKMAISINPTTHVLFDNEGEDNLAGVGFKTYESEGSLEYAEGFAIVLNKSTILDKKLVGDFDIEFSVPGFKSTSMEFSKIISKEELQDPSGRLIIIYGFNSYNVE